jgi:hypothetical protein
MASAWISQLAMFDCQRVSPCLFHQYTPFKFIQYFLLVVRVVQLSSVQNLGWWVVRDYTPQSINIYIYTYIYTYICVYIYNYIGDYDHPIGKSIILGVPFFTRFSPGHAPISSPPTGTTWCRWCVGWSPGGPWLVVVEGESTSRTK